MSLESRGDTVGTVSEVPEVNAQHPWLGLLPYKEEHREFFFGRDRESEDILGRIRDNSLTILYGQSGLGKSSLLAAGVAPRLRESGFAPKIVRLRFSKRATLREQMLAMLPNRPPFVRSALDPTWLPGQATFWELFHRKTSSTIEHPVPILIFDQFEEIFTLGAQPQFEAEVADWLEQMADLIQNRPPHQLAKAFAKDRALAERYHFGDAPVRVVFTLREDFLANLERWKARLPLLMQNRMALTLLTGPQARQAVLGPAQLGDHSLVSREVAESIVRTVARVSSDTPLDQIKAVPPLLSLLCEQLNAARLSAEAPQITGESVRDQAADILQRFYEDSFLTFPPEHRARIRALLEDPPMITEAGYRNALVRADAEAQLTRAGVADAKTIFDTLIQRRLITAETRDQVQRLEITHDVLVPMVLRSRKERQERDAVHRTAQAEAEAAKQRSIAEHQRQIAERERQLAEKARKAEAEVVAAKSAAVKSARRLSLGAGLVLAMLATGPYYSFQRERDARARLFAAEAERDLVIRDYARAEIAAAQSLLYRDVPATRELLLMARSGGVSFVTSSRRQGEEAFLSAFSNDGALRAVVLGDTGGDPRLVELVSTNDNKPLGIIDITAFGGMPECLAIASPVIGTHLLAMARPDHTVAIWTFSEGKFSSSPLELASPEEAEARHSKRVPSLAFHPSKPWIATCSEDKKLCLWDYSKTPAKLIWKQDEAHYSAVHGIAFSKDGSLLASGGGDYLVKIWDVGRLQAGYDAKSRHTAHQVEPISVMKGHSDSVVAVAFSPDGKRLASGGYDRLIRIWDITLMMAAKQGDGITALTHPTVGTFYGNEGAILGLSFSRDSKLLISGSKNTARVWDAAEGRVLVALQPDCGVIRSVTCQEFGGEISCAGENGWAIWSVRGRKVAARLWNGAPVGAITFDSLGNFVVAGGNDGTLHVWNSQNQLVRTLDAVPVAGINGVTISADGRWLAAAGEGKVINVWDISADWAKVRPAQGGEVPKEDHAGAIWGLCFDPKGRWLASGNTDEDKRIKRWNIPDWSLRDQSPGPTLNDSVYALTCDPEGRWLISGDSLARVAVRRASDLALIDEVINVKTGETNVWTLAVCPHPLSILSGNSDGKVYRWIPKIDEWPGSPKGERIGISAEDAKINHSINSVSYSPKYKWVAAGGDGGSVEIYDADLKKIRSLVGHDGAVWCVAFNQQGTRLASGGSDNFMRVWDVDEMKRNLESYTPQALIEETRKATGLTVDHDRITAVK